MISCGVFHPHAGGAESLFRDLSRLWVEQGHKIVVVTRQLEGASEEEWLDGAFVVRSDYGLPYDHFAWSWKLLRFPVVLARLWRAMRDSDIRVVCIGLLDMSVVYLLCLRVFRRFRLVTYLHGGEVRELPGRSRAFRRLLSTALRASDEVVAVSAALASDARPLCADLAAKTTVIPNGIDLETIDGAPRLTRERPYVVYVGRLAPDKHVADVIRAFARAFGDLPGIDLMLVGDGPEALALKELAADSGVDERVVFRGRVEREEVYSIMKGALLLVLASPAEGHPIAVIEALAAGTPVVASRVTGTRETIEDGVNGALFTAGDWEACARLLRHYAEDVEARGKLAANARSWDRESIDIRRLADIHLGILGGS